MGNPYGDYWADSRLQWADYNPQGISLTNASLISTKEGVTARQRRFFHKRSREVADVCRFREGGRKTVEKGEKKRRNRKSGAEVVGIWNKQELETVLKRLEERIGKLENQGRVAEANKLARTAKNIWNRLSYLARKREKG